MRVNDMAQVDAVIGHLEDWAHWQRGYRIRIGFSPKSAGFSTGGIVSDESGDDYSHVDQARFEMIDACICDLPPDQSAAIHHRFLASVFRMRDYPGSLAKALDALHGAFKRRCVLC